MKHLKTQRSLAQKLTEYTAIIEENDASPVVEEVSDQEISSSWSGVIVVEGTPTGDGRLIEDGALQWEATQEDPILLRYVKEDVGAHDGAQVAGRIFSIERLEDGRIWASGDFDMGSEIGREARRQVSEKLTRGVSVDMDDVSFEVRVAADVLEDDLLLDDAISEEDVEDSEDTEGTPEEFETDEDGRITVAKVSREDELFVTTEARIRAATLVATPAFSQAYISIDTETAETSETDEAAEEVIEAEETYIELSVNDMLEVTDDKGKALGNFSKDSLIAAAAPVYPPDSWFADPKLTGPTALRVSDDGAIFGHVATWDTCHIANPGGSGQCVTAPKSMTDYAYFHTGLVKTDSGAEFAVGHITMDTGHAKPHAKHSSAAGHYENTGTVVADVRAGEDAYGIWIAGGLRPKVNAEQVRALRSSPLSGDWRSVAGNLEMVAALAVNVPGFPIPRPQGMVASGAMVSLTAAGIAVPEDEINDADGSDEGYSSNSIRSQLSESDVKYLKKLAQHSRAQHGQELASRVAKRKSELNRRKVQSFTRKNGSQKATSKVKK